MADCCPKFLVSRHWTGTTRSDGKNSQSGQNSSSRGSSLSKQGGTGASSRETLRKQSGKSSSDREVTSERSGVVDSTGAGTGASSRETVRKQGGTSSSDREVTSERSGVVDSTVTGAGVNSREMVSKQGGTSTSERAGTSERVAAGDSTGAGTKTTQSGSRVDMENQGGANNSSLRAGSGSKTRTLKEDEGGHVDFDIIVRGTLETTQSLCEDYLYFENQMLTFGGEPITFTP